VRDELSQVIGAIGREWNDYNPKSEMRIPEWMREEAA